MSDNPPPPDYDAIEQEMWRANALQTPELLAGGDADLQRKMETYAYRFGYAVEQVREKIAADPMFAAHFAKQPTRQRPGVGSGRRGACPPPSSSRSLSGRLEEGGYAEHTAPRPRKRGAARKRRRARPSTERIIARLADARQRRPRPSRH